MDDHAEETVSDETLVRRGKQGDARALDTLVERHHEIVYRAAYGILRDPDRAADAAQETFLKAVRSLDSFRGDARFRTWLLSIAVNEARGALRKHGRRREQALEREDLGAVEADAQRRLELAEEARRVMDVLATLPEKQRLAVQLRTQEDLSFREIGEIIESSEGAARVNYHHGIRRLRELLT